MSNTAKFKRHAPPSRTTALPASLRAELVELGHLPSGKKAKARKEKRKAARNDGKAARAEHFAKKKRALQEVEDEGEEEEEEEEIKQPVQKKKKVAAVVVKSIPEPVVKTTALERMLAKQQGVAAGNVDVKRKKNKVESTEDQEIAWLEAKLGVRGGAPVASSEKGKWKEEYMDDGLDDLFAGIDDLETAAFGNSKKDYRKMLAEEGDDSAADGSESDGQELNEYGVSDEEFFDPGDDDDHREMGELGSEDEEEGGMEMTFPGGMEATFDAEEFEDDDYSGSGVESESESEGEEEEEATPVPSAKKSVRFDSTVPTPPVASTSTSTRYVPPHLRQATASSSNVSTTKEPVAALADLPEDPRLKRQIMGLLNKLSSSNIPSILTVIADIYAAHPRALVSSTLTSLLLEIISGRDNLGEQFVITYAALVAALSKSIGIEFPAGVIAKSVIMFDEAHAKNVVAKEKEKRGESQGGFEGRPGSKECENIVAFLAELYNFSVVACVLVYDLVKMFIENGLEELEVELLVKVIKRCGQQLRQDDPSSLKEIITMVKQKMSGIDSSTMNSRTRFMIDSLTNLKNNKIKPNAEGAVDNYSSLKKFLSSLRKKSGSTPEALRLTLSDIRSSSSKGKWWIVGAAWGGDPLVDAKASGGLHNKETESEAVLTKLARSQGMNTDIRKSVFVVLMSSEDYVDAVERLLQLGLTDIQQREIARVLLQCAGNEKTYNPYYTLVAHRMGMKSHSFQITLQYCLWDFMREFGEKTVGGEEMVKTMTIDASDTGGNASKRRISNLAKVYAWCVAKDVLALTILKPIPFARPKPQTILFLQQFFSALIISSQSVSPALILTSTATRKDKEALERIFVKAAPHAQLVKGLSYFLDLSMDEVVENSERDKEKALLKWGVRVGMETLSMGGGIVG